jgi:molybdate-binding protein/DNA-binding XRE family transcriptional regulator
MSIIIDNNMPEIQARLKTIREERKLPAAELAKRIGVSRQTIYAIEDGSFVPNTAIALRLARVLDMPVETLFSLSDELQDPELQIEAELLTGVALTLQEGQSVRLCSLGNRQVAVLAAAISNYLPDADGVIESSTGRNLRVRCLRPLPEDDKTLLVAGCDPALSFVEELLGASGFRVVTVPCSSRKALEWLKEGRVHVAGSHLRDTAHGEYNTPAIKRLFPKGGVRVVTFAAWEEGLVTRQGNPKNIRSIADLGRKGVTIINREKGSGSRGLLDSGLAKAGIPKAALSGYEIIAQGHLAAAYAVASGSADCCIATRAAARCYGLEFTPLSEERFDLAMKKATLESAAGIALLDLLNRSKLPQQLRLLAGYDVSRTGSILM